MFSAGMAKREVGLNSGKTCSSLSAEITITEKKTIIIIIIIIMIIMIISYILL